MDSPAGFLLGPAVGSGLVDCVAGERQTPADRAAPVIVGESDGTRDNDQGLVHRGNLLSRTDRVRAVC